MLDLVGDGLSELSLTGSFGLEKLSKGNTGDEMNLPLLVGNNIPEMSLNVSLDVVNSVGEKYRQSRKGFAAATFQATSANSVLPLSIR